MVILQNTCICLDLSIGSMLERLVLKNASECTSQRLKRISGARVMKQFESFAFGKNRDLIKFIFLGVRSPYEEILYLLRLVTVNI